MPDPLPKYARVDIDDPECFAQCDRCGFWFNGSKLSWQYEWAGQHLYNTGALVCTSGPSCFDVPQEQLRTIILPPDPEPVLNARVPNFDYEEQTVIVTQFGANTKLPPWGAGPTQSLCNQAGTVVFTLQYLTSS